MKRHEHLMAHLPLKKPRVRGDLLRDLLKRRERCADHREVVRSARIEVPGELAPRPRPAGDWHRAQPERCVVGEQRLAVAGTVLCSSAAYLPSTGKDETDPGGL